MKSQATSFIHCTRKNIFGIFLSLMLLLGFASNAQISSTTITVNDSSHAATGISATETDICNGESSTLTVTGGELGTGASWAWYEDACGTGPSVGAGNSIVVTPSNATTASITKTYFVRAEGSCNTTTCASVTITIHPTPAAVAPADIVACYQQAVAAVPLSGTPSSGLTFNIAGGADVGIADVSGTTSIAAFTAQNTTTDTIVRTVTITPVANGCTGTPVSFTVIVLPQVTIDAVADIVVCNGVTVNVPAFTSAIAGSGTVTYDWSNDLTSIGLSASGTGNIVPFPGTNTTCNDAVATISVTPSYTVSGLMCSGNPETFTVTVHPSPNGTLAGGTICEGEPTPLTFDATCGTSPWSLDIAVDGIAPTTNYPGITDGGTVPVPAPSSGTTTYNLMTITDGNGCVRTAP